jgi:hypothetical protein
MASKVRNNGADPTQALIEWSPIVVVKGGGVKKDYRQARAAFMETQPRSVRFVNTLHRLGGYAPGVPIGSSGIPIHPAR